MALVHHVNLYYQVGPRDCLQPRVSTYVTVYVHFDAVNSASIQEFWNWFDPTAWYPLGRVVGGTIYPGLMATSGVIHIFLRSLNLPVDIRNICVLLAPGFSALTAWATYMYVAPCSTYVPG
jgi:hypothetical protein